MSPQDWRRPETVLVVGATGRTGRHIVDGLIEAGVGVRALVRHPLTAELPDEVTVIEGTLQDVDAVRQAATGADSAFLLWMGDDPSEVPPVVEALTEQVGHVVYLSASDLDNDGSAEGSVQPGIWADVESALEQSGSTWTFLRGGGFAANTLEWADQIRSGDVVRVLYPEAGRSVVDERDLAQSAVRGLLDPALVGQAYSLTGPATLTQREQVTTIGDVLGRELVVQELDPEEARPEYEEAMGTLFAGQALQYWASLVEHPEPVTAGAKEALGREPHPFEDWVRLHRTDFERLTTGQVAHQYAAAFRSGRLTDASMLLAPDVVRVAPLEDGGIEREVLGLVSIAENAERQTEDVTIEAVEVGEPLVGVDQFAIRFTFDEIVRDTGKPRRTVKISLCTVASSRIIREEVFYYLYP